MMNSALRPPKNGRALIDEYFIENRTRLLDVAAYLDRLDRATDPAALSDFRTRAFREALAVLCSGEYPRVKQVQMILSDPTTEPLDRLDQKSARGAYDRWTEEG
jgi:hypothetical protein